MSNNLLFQPGEAGLSPAETKRENDFLLALEGDAKAQARALAHEIDVRETYNSELEIQLANDAIDTNGFDPLPVPASWDEIEAELDSDVHEMFEARCRASIHASHAVRRAR